MASYCFAADASFFFPPIKSQSRCALREEKRKRRKKTAPCARVCHKQRARLCPVHHPQPRISKSIAKNANGSGWQLRAQAGKQAGELLIWTQWKCQLSFAEMIVLQQIFFPLQTTSILEIKMHLTPRWLEISSFSPFLMDFLLGKKKKLWLSNPNKWISADY